MLIRSAIKTKDNFIYLGIRHGDVFKKAKEAGEPKETFKDCIQGFVDKEGKFYTRAEAADYAYECGQITEDKFNEIEGVLTSEDLW